MKGDFPRKTETALLLDGLGHRYGVLPSTIMGLDPLSGEALILNMRVMTMAVEALNKDGSVSSEIKQKRRKWDSDMVKELKEKGYNVG